MNAPRTSHHTCIINHMHTNILHFEGKIACHNSYTEQKVLSPSHFSAMLMFSFVTGFMTMTPECLSYLLLQ